MSDVTIPAPAAAEPVVTTIPATPADTALTQDAITSPAIEPGTEQPTTATEDTSQDKTAEPTPAELARKQRNRERWQAMKQERESALAEAARLRAENDRLLGRTDYSQIDDPDEALAARTADRLAERMAGTNNARADEHQARAQDALAKAWDAQVEEMKARAPDFDQVFNASVPVHQRAAPFIAESDRGGELAYFLGKNPDVARDLYQKFDRNPASALIELGRLEAKLDAPAPKKTSSAPRPAPIIQGGSNPLAFDASRASVSDMKAYLRKEGIIR